MKKNFNKFFKDSLSLSIITVFFLGGSIFFAVLFLKDKNYTFLPVFIVLGLTSILLSICSIYWWYSDLKKYKKFKRR